MDDYESLSHTKWECTTYCSFPSIAMPVRLSERGALDRRCAAMSCNGFCLVSI